MNEQEEELTPEERARFEALLRERSPALGRRAGQESRPATFCWAVE